MPEEDHDPVPHHRLPRRRVIVVCSALLAATAVVCVGAAVASADRTTAKSPSQSPIAGATTTVQRTDLDVDAEFDGTVRLGEPWAISGRGSGTITALPAVGGEIRRGTQLYRVNDRPVVALLGRTPLYRELGRRSTSGPDIAMLADNLHAVGLLSTKSKLVAGRTGWTDDLTHALQLWQKKVGLVPDGTISPSEAVVLPTAMLVTEESVHVGQPAAGPLMTLAEDVRRVSFTASSTDASDLIPEESVTVTLPSGATAPGRVGAITPSVRSGSDASSSSDAPSVTVAVSLTGVPSGKDVRIGAARIAVHRTVEHDVLVVPTSALLALQEGGYALQLPTGRLVPATLGRLVGGRAEISGAGIHEGLRVVMAS